jgi:hypothetical protein
MSAATAIDLEPRRLRAVPDPPRPPKPPPPAPETLRGIGEGIHEIQVQQGRDSRKLDELGRDVADINATVTVHGREIRQIRSTLEEHGDRIVELERLPRGPLPRVTTSQARDSIPPQVAALGKASKSGSWTWDAEAMSAVVVGMREQLDVLEEEKRVSTALAEEREKAAELADRKSAHLRGWLAVTIAGLVMLAGLFAYLAPRLAK